jgi:DNA-binding FadR family transcriptional regulator
MALQPVARRSVPDEVFDQILDDVVSGEFVPGESLPSERKLAEVLGVSRPAVREALQRVAQAGLVEVRQGDATTVRDYRRHASLDLLPRLLLPRGELDPSVARSILEARLLVGPKVAALAAERAGARLGKDLRECVAALEDDPDPVARQRVALAFWDHIVDGADSIVFRLMFNSLRGAYEPALGALATLMDAEVSQVDVYRTLADAIVAGDADGARRAAEDLLGPATAAILAAIRKLEEL